MRIVNLKVKEDAGIFNPELKEVLGKVIQVNSFVVVNNHINAILEYEYFSEDHEYTSEYSSDWIPLEYFEVDEAKLEEIKEVIIANTHNAVIRGLK